jgi:hypothetical protein
VKAFFGKVRWNWLQLLVATLLPLHAGFAQAAMVMPTRSADVAVEVAPQSVASEPVLMPDGMPCHHDANSSPTPDHPAQHKGGCCDAGSCHCAAACGLPMAIARIAPQPGFVEPPFAFLSVPAAAHPPDLRPPIG